MTNMETTNTPPQKIHWKKLRNPDYLGSYDFQPNEERIVTIKNVLVVSVKSEKTSDCTVVELENSKPFILNSGNGKVLEKIFETPYIEDWKGKSFKLVVRKVKAFGEIVEALRIVSEKIAKPKPILEIGTKKFEACQERYRADNSVLAKIKETYSLTNEVLHALIS